MLNNDLEVFIALVESGSFSNAARHLRTTQATVSRRLKALEEFLSMALINRDTRNFEITIAGNKLYQGFKTQQNELNQLIDQLKNSKQQISGTVRISLPIGISYFVISPYIGDFLRKYPDLNLELCYQHNVVDIMKDNFDIAITDYIPLQQSTLIRKIVTLSPKLFCTPKYIERYGMPLDIIDLNDKKHLCAGFLSNLNYDYIKIRAYNEKQGTTQIISNTSQFLTNNALHNKAIVTSGHVIVFGWGPMFTEEIKNGTIINVLPDYSFDTFNIYLQRSNNHVSTVVDKVIKFIDECFARLPN